MGARPWEAAQRERAAKQSSAAYGYDPLTGCRKAGGLAQFRFMGARVSPAGVFPRRRISAQTLKYSKPPDAKNGERIYKDGCIACHGATGNGAPMTSTEFKRPGTFPDFSNCSQTTPEPNIAWKAVIVYGGPARGFSQIMPSFGELLSSPDNRRRHRLCAQFLYRKRLAARRVEPATSPGDGESFS